MTSAYAGLFKRQAASYAQHRPSYPQELYQKIYDFAALQHRDTALDIATGSGQAAAVLAQSFKRVIAQDVEAEQLKQATLVDNVIYQQATAESTGLSAGSVDLVTVAQALHWFDLPAFWREAARVLRPGGACAAWGYDMCEPPLELLCAHPALCALDTDIIEDSMTRALRDLYSKQLGPYWADRRKLVESEYAGMEPKHGFRVVERARVDMPKDMSISDIAGYVESWSAYATYRSRHPDAADPVCALRDALLAAFDTKDEQHSLTVVWPVFTILAEHPEPAPGG